MPAEGSVALSRYKHLTALDPFKLGLLVTARGLELHLLRIVDDTAHIIDRFELTGQRSKDRYAHADGRSVAILKPDRGKLIFQVQGDRSVVSYSNLSKVGGMLLHIHSYKLNPNGRRVVGASNQSLEHVFIPRLPSDPNDILQLSSAVAANRHRLAGLSDSRSHSEFCRGMKGIFHRWNELQPRERILAIRQQANETLMLSGVYPCYFPEGQIASWSAFSPNTPCRFIPAEWSIYRSPDFVEQKTLTPREEVHFAASLYAELRGAEQTWLVLRYLAGKHTGALDASRLPRALAKIAEAARSLAITCSPEEAIHLDMLLDSITTETTDHKTRSFLGERYRHSPTFNFEDRLRQKLGLPYLFHQRDAAEAARRIRREWARS
jgi:hypothetical protein